MLQLRRDHITTIANGKIHDEPVGAYPRQPEDLDARGMAGCAPSILRPLRHREVLREGGRLRVARRPAALGSERPTERSLRSISPVAMRYGPGTKPGP